MFWGCLSTKGVGALVQVNGVMKKEDYRDILKGKINKNAMNLGMGRRWIFQHKIDPKYILEFVFKLLADERFYVFPWPS